MMTDPIADLLTRLRNGIKARQERVEVPYSKIKLGILQVLEQQGYIKTFSPVMDGQKGKILVTLKYTPAREPLISRLSRVSKPGRRVYLGYEKIKPVLGGIGLMVLSTSKGLMTDKQAKEAKLGGEVLCTVW